MVIESSSLSLRIAAVAGLLLLVALPSLTLGGPMGFPGWAREDGRQSSERIAAPTLTPNTAGGNIVGTISVGNEPMGVGYDSDNGYVYVANAGSATVSVISGTTVLATIPIGGAVADYTGVAYDHGNGYVYVTSSGSKNVTVISGTTVVAKIPLGDVPYGVAYDSKHGYVYVAVKANLVEVISGTTVVAGFADGFANNPLGVGYDSSNGYIYVANSGVGNVTVYDGITFVGSVQVGGVPYGVAYDSRNGYVYVTTTLNGGTTLSSGTVTVISGMTVAATIPVGYTAAGVGYDSGAGYVYVTNPYAPYLNNNITVIDDTTVVSTIRDRGNTPIGVAYDTENGYIYVTNTGSATVTVINTIVTAPSVATVSCGSSASCSVQSNATLSKLSFNGTTVEVEADGPSGAQGYANVTVPRAIIHNISNMHVFVDHSIFSSSAIVITSNSTEYFIYFIFTFHSPVLIDIRLTSSGNPATPNILGLDPTLLYTTVGVGIIALIVIVGGAFTLSRRKAKVGT